MFPKHEKSQIHWLKQYAISRRIVAAVAAFWFVAALSLYHASLGDYLESKIAAPINFKVRQWLGKAPVQDTHLKIFALDDKTFAWLGTSMPDLKLWGDLLDGIAESKPRLIVVDAMLSSRPNESEKDLRFYFSRLQELGVPVVLGSFTSPTELAFKTPLVMKEAWYDLEHYLPDSSVVTEGRGRLSHVPSWPIRDTWHAYGPALALQPWFPKVGHFQLLSDHKIDPFIRLSETKVLPHVSMFAAHDVKFSNGNLRIDEHRVALDRHGAIDVNFRPTSSWKIHSLLEPLQDVRDGYAVKGVNQGDVVLVLPLYFTGNTDFRPSPFGPMSGGLYLAAMLNSVLSGEWLQPVLAMEVITGLGLIGVVLVVHLATSGAFWISILSGMTLLFATSQIGFSSFGLVIPWLIPSMAIGFASTHLFTLKMRANERKVMMLRSALEGAVDSTQLDNLLRRPEALNLEPRERVVTLMFIDVVGFSLSAENMLPRLAFDCLKRILSDITEIVHRHGGVVDKSLGDGLLCYFGYRFDSDITVSDHAEQAFQCAIEIQKQSLEENLKAMKSAEPLYPLRIGVNTASSYLGDLGTANRIEFTVVGNGVNFAKRLEGACEMFSVMLGATTWELVRGVDIDRSFVSRKLIRIKHHKELMDAFEYDPMHHQADLRDKIAEAFRKSSNLQRLNERIPVRDSNALILTCDYGRGNVVNFSGTGISLQLNTALTRGSRVIISLNSPDEKLKPALAAIGIREMEAEVRWNYHSQGSFIHGLVFKNLTEQQAESFVHIVSEFAFLDSKREREVADFEKLVS